MKLYTKQGDGGQTSLFDGTRVGKDDARVSAYGAVDELNAQLGVTSVIIAQLPAIAAEIQSELESIQNQLFCIGAELATPSGSKRSDNVPKIMAKDVSALESCIDRVSAALPPLDTFTLPGGGRSGAQLHVCRTVCRRAERQVVATAESLAQECFIIPYLNRLGDLLFAWARLATRIEGAQEVVWKKPE